MLKLIYLLSPVQLHALVWTKCVRELVAIAWCAIIMPQSLRCISLIVFWIVKLYNYSVITSTGTMRCYKNIDYTIVLQCYLSCYIPILLSRLPPNTTWHSVIQTIASHGYTQIWLKPLDQATHCFNRNYPTKSSIAILLTSWSLISS